MEGPKYPALTTIATFYRLLAWVTVVVTIGLVLLGVIAAFVSGDYIGGGIFGFLGELLGAVFGSIIFAIAYGVIGFVVATLQLAVAEVLQVVMDIEANTRS